MQGGIRPDADADYLFTNTQTDFGVTDPDNYIPVADPDDYFPIPDAGPDAGPDGRLAGSRHAEHGPDTHRSGQFRSGQFRSRQREQFAVPERPVNISL